jgi:hypothetical protein
MTRQTINGVTVDLAPGQSVNVDSAGNVNITNSSGQVVQQVQSRPGLGRVMAEGAAAGVGVGAGIAAVQSIIEGIFGD